MVIAWAYNTYMDKQITIKCQSCGKVKKIDADKYGRDNLKCYCDCMPDTPMLMIDIKVLKDVKRKVKGFKI